MNEEDRNAADDWIRDNMPDLDQYSLEDSEEQGETQSYFFLRYRDSATVVYKVAVKDGKVTRLEVYHGEGSQEEPDEQQWLVKPKPEEPFKSDGATTHPLPSRKLKPPPLLLPRHRHLLR